MKFKFYLVNEDGLVEGTDDPEIAKAALHDGSTILINYDDGTAGFGGEIEKIERSEAEDWIKVVPSPPPFGGTD